MIQNGVKNQILKLQNAKKKFLPKNKISKKLKLEQFVAEPK